MADNQAAALRYYELLRQGVPPQQAFQQAFPNGLPTREQQQKDAAKKNQSAAFAQTGGALAGALGTKALYDAVTRTGWFKPDAKTGQLVEVPKGTAGAEQMTVQTPTAPQGGTGSTLTNALDSGAAANGVPMNSSGQVLGTDSGAAANGVQMSADGRVLNGGGDVTVVSTNPDGSKAMSDGTTVTTDGTVKSSTGETIGNGALIVGGALQAYNGYGQYKDGEKLGGGANMAGGAYNAAAGGAALAGYSALADYVPYVGAAVAGAQIGQNMMNDKGATNDRAAKSQAEAQKAALLFIPGYGWVAYAALAALDAATGGKASQQLMKWNKKIDSFNDRIDFGVGQKVRDIAFHQSTRGVQQQHTGELAAKAHGDEGYLQYLQGMREQHNHGPADPQNPFGDTKGNKFRNFEEYKKSGLDAANLTGVYGNLDAYNPEWAKQNNVADWSKLSFDQQQKITQMNIDQGLYNSKKGEVVISDRDKARQNFLSVIGGTQPPTTPLGAPAQNPDPYHNQPMAGQQIAAALRPGGGSKDRTPQNIWRENQAAQRQLMAQGGPAALEDNPYNRAVAKYNQQFGQQLVSALGRQ